MKKVGICAVYNKHNYGSMLQSLATQKAFELCGFDCEMIRYKKKKNIAFYIKQFPRIFNRILMNDKRLVIQKKINMLFHKEAARENNIRNKAFDRFEKKYFTKLSQIYYGYENLKKGALNYAAVISGSDQVLSPGGLATHFYDLTFVPESIIKASYASSFGVKKIPSYQIKRTQYYINRMNYFSVREIAGQKIVKELTNKDVPVVCDPTFLFNADQWGEWIEKKSIVEGPYIFAYFLGPSQEHRDEATKFAKEHNIKIVTTHHMDQYVKADVNFGDIVLSDVGPEEFVNLIRGATYVITDSFHGTIFSVIHEKKFVVFNRYGKKAKISKNSRIESICSLLGLNDRRYNGDLCSQLDKEIDYKKVRENTNKMREISFNYLNEVAKSIRGQNND